MEYIVKLVLDSLKAQLLDAEETKRLEEQVEEAMSVHSTPRLNLKYESSIRTLDSVSKAVYIYELSK